MKPNKLLIKIAQMVADKTGLTFYPHPKRQLFHVGQRVKVSVLPECMSHFDKGKGIIKYSYDQKCNNGFPGCGLPSYCIQFDNGKESCWYPENIITDL